MFLVPSPGLRRASGKGGRSFSVCPADGTGTGRPGRVGSAHTARFIRRPGVRREALRCVMSRV